MNLSVKNISGVPILSQEKEIDVAESVLFSTETGKIKGIVSKKNQFFSFDSILFSHKKIILHAEKFSKKSGENWLGYNVKTVHGEDMGEITDIEYDPEIGVLQRILVTKSVFALPFSRHIFPYHRIVNIRKKVVLVDDDNSEKEAKKEFCPA